MDPWCSPSAAASFMDLLDKPEENPILYRMVRYPRFQPIVVFAGRYPRTRNYLTIG